MPPGGATLEANAIDAPSHGPSRRQRRVHGLLDGRAEAGDALDVAVHRTLVGAILVAVGALVLGSVPEVAGRAGRALAALDWALGTVFAAEYLLRLWSAPACPRYAGLAPWRARWRWVRSPLALLDLAATLALLLPLLPVALREARLVRLFTLLRVGKLGRLGQSAEVFARAFRARRDDLTLAAGLVAGVLLVGSTLVYFAERDAQPERFGSIPEALWWGVATVTTVGYGDVVPTTALGRVLGGLIAVGGVGGFSLFTAVLGAALLEELQREREARAAGAAPCAACDGTGVARVAAGGAVEDPAARGPRRPSDPA